MLLDLEYLHGSSVLCPEPRHVARWERLLHPINVARQLLLAHETERLPPHRQSFVRRLAVLLERALAPSLDLAQLFRLCRQARQLREQLDELLLRFLEVHPGVLLVVAVVACVVCRLQETKYRIVNAHINQCSGDEDPESQRDYFFSHTTRKQQQ